MKRRWACRWKPALSALTLTAVRAHLRWSCPPGALPARKVMVAARRSRAPLSAAIAEWSTTRRLGRPVGGEESGAGGAGPGAAVEREPGAGPGLVGGSMSMSTYSMSNAPGGRTHVAAYARCGNAAPSFPPATTTRTPCPEGHPQTSGGRRGRRRVSVPAPGRDPQARSARAAG